MINIPFHHRSIAARALCGLMCMVLVPMQIPSAETPPAGSPDRVTIQLRDRVESDADVLLIRDIADVITTSSKWRDKVESLDVAEFSHRSSEVTITKAQVDLRLRLAADSTMESLVVGPPAVVVVRPPRPAAADGEVTERIREELATIWNVDQGSVRVRMLQPLPDDLFSSPQAVDRLQVVAPLTSRPGNVRLQLLVYGADRLDRTHSVLASAELYVDTIVAARELPRGHVLTRDDVVVQPRAVRHVQATKSPESVLGKSTRIAIRENQVIEHHHVTEPTAGRGESDIKPRDVVRLIAKRGGLTVTVADAEALSAGSVGDTIRVRNPRSNKILVGRVVGPNVVEMRF